MFHSHALQDSLEPSMSAFTNGGHVRLPAKNRWIQEWTFLQGQGHAQEASLWPETSPLYPFLVDLA